MGYLLSEPRVMDRGEGCKTCLANGGCISPEECMGCNGKTPCNHDYFPSSYNPDGTPIKKKISFDDLSHPF
jgi:hypothetical protein